MPHFRFTSKPLTACAMLVACLSPSLAQNPAPTHFNHVEDAVPAYVEPDVLRMVNGKKVTTPAQWLQYRRPEILHLLQTDMFGFAPSHRLRLRVYRKEEDRHAMGGLATREQVTLVPQDAKSELAIHILLYLPNGNKARSPVFIGLNFSGNQSVTLDPGVDLNRVWLPNTGDHLHMHPEQATNAMRGTAASEWPIEAMLRAGYGFASVYDGDLEPDFDGGSAFGFRSLPELAENDVPSPQRWGAIAVWAWGFSRALDYFETAPRVDPRKVIVIGHSRLGKAALWAGATDRRFAMIISNESGKGGAALMKRNFGETVEHLNTRFPYWFDGNFPRYSDHTGDMPFDSHFLLALIAPRPLYIASAAGDFTLDARGEYLAGHLASCVYRLFGYKGLESPEPPDLVASIRNRIGYHMRPGKHDMTSYDWDQYLRFAGLYVPPPRR